jgi:ABC-type iron transport system FetAB ATPase subunit
MFSSTVTPFLKTASMEGITRFLNGPSGAVVLSGPSGSGKAALVTQAATAIGRTAKMWYQWTEISSSNVQAWVFFFRSDL